MTQTILLSVFLVVTSFGLSQNNVKVNQILEMNKEIFGVSEVLNLWTNFLNAENDSIASQFWNQKEVQQLGFRDYFELSDLDYFEFGDKIQSLQQGTTILNNTHENDIYKITSQMHLQMEDGLVVIPFVFHVYAKREVDSGELKLYNPGPINKLEKMSQKKVGNITYIFPTPHEFNKQLASKQVKEIKLIAKKLGVHNPSMTFIFASNRTEYYELQGYDYNFSDIGKERPTGWSNTATQTAYSHGLGEYYPHELIHILLKPNFPNCHKWFNEGTCTYFGQSRGKDLEYHLDKTRKYLIEHPEINLNNVLDPINLDDETDFRYVIGGFFVKQTLAKGGFDLLKILLGGGLYEDDFYATIEKVLDVKRNDLNLYIRRNL